MVSYDYRFFKTIDSTSSEAKRLIDGGSSLPLLIQASTQNQGRGRTGRSWSSPAGNLYLTLAVSGEEIPQQDIPRLPLKLAYLLASWLRTTFQLRVTIKWPNDILFGGQKLGGVLCEIQHHNQTWGPVTIGIGLNLSVSPAVDQATTCLQDQGKTSTLTIEDLGKSLGDFILSRLYQPFEIHFLQDYGIEEGQIWTDGHQLHQQLAIQEDGHLSLVNCLSKDQVKYSHTHHTLQWLYQEDSVPVFIADAGNSALKLACIGDDGTTEIFYVDYENGLDAEQEEALLKRRPQRFWPIHGAVVADNRRSLVIDLCRSLGFSYCELPKRPLRVSFDAYNFAEIGIDRVAICEAMAHRNSSERGNIAISLGTAVTIDVVGEHHRYLGGWILPGLQTGLNALHKATARLPQVSLSGNPTRSLPPLLGYNTRSSLYTGAIWNLVFGVRCLVEELKALHPNLEWQLYLTGGEADLVAPLIEGELVETLIVEGMALLAKGGATFSGTSKIKENQ